MRKAVKWNSPFYGIEGQGWFLSFHGFTNYVKVTFFRGASLRPVPARRQQEQDARYIDIHEGDEFDEAQMASWVKQAAALPRLARASTLTRPRLTPRSVMPGLDPLLSG